MGGIILTMKGIDKSFPGVHALDHVDLEVRKGEVLALMGENGAGKSTLMKVLTGIYKKDSGTITYEGKEVEFKNTREAQDAGIVIVHQELNMLGHLTVAQNLFIGREFKKGITIDDKKMNEEAKKLFDRLNVDIDPKEKMSNLTVGKQQMCEIAKAVSFDAKVIIFDEPSAALTEKEIADLFEIIKDLRKKGLGIVYISHRMDEIKVITDRVTVMRDGGYVGTLITADSTKEDIINMMVGRVIYEDPKDHSMVAPDAPVVLKVEHLNAGKMVQDVSFELHKGEILGFGGLSESGMHEIGKAIFGASYDRTGSVTLADGTQINDIPTAIKHSIAYTSKDRDNESVVLNQSIGDNICLPSLDELAGKSHLLSDKKRKEFADKYAKQMSVKMNDVNQFVSNLSGGNKQKVVLARWIEKDSDIVVLDSPTRGIDIKVKQDIYQLMNQMRKNGKSIIMISEELMELIGMSDRIIIMKDGKISGELERNQNLDENGLISMMV
mgnify:CR=1 FL=1